MAMMSFRTRWAVFTDAKATGFVWIGGAVALYVLSWRALIPKGTTDYARGSLVLGITVASAAIAYFLMLTIVNALGF